MLIDTPYCAVEPLLPHYCFKYDVEAYEFWGIRWMTYDPHRFGWHAYIPFTDQPGQLLWARNPNGDGFLLYPGHTAGYDGPLSSIRLEQAREGIEDYEYLYLLRQLMAKAKAAGKDTTAAEQALACRTAGDDSQRGRLLFQQDFARSGRTVFAARTSRRRDRRVGEPLGR